MGLTVAVAGAGAVALGTAALAASRGHAARVWSPSGRAATGTPGRLTAEGALEGSFAVEACAGPDELARGADLVVLALPANGHRAVMARLAPHLAPGRAIAVSSHASFGALHLAALLADRGVAAPIAAWGTTAVTGRAAAGGTDVRVNTVRARVDACVVPEAQGEAALAPCREAFGDRFVPREGLLAITLSNLNPQNHLGIALGNMTRMERGERWGQGENVTPNVGRLLEALDAERLGVARALGLEVKTIFEHFHQSFHVPMASIHAMNRAMHERGTGGTGPDRADSRYVLEDVPFGLVPIVRLARLAGAPARLHEAGVAILGAMYGRDLASENDLLPAIGFDGLTLDDLQAAGRTGRLPLGRAPAPMGPRGRDADRQGDAR